MEPVKGGTLADVPLEAEKLMEAHAPGMTPASWAVRFAASREGVIMVLSGMSDYSQLLDNTAYMQDFVLLTEEEEGIVARAAEIIQSATAIACTSCQYCVEGCPKQIPIPKYFSLYNQYSLFGEKSNSRGYYQNYGGRYGKAGDCIGCRRCEAICPQHLPIVQHMKEIAEVFEPAK